LVKGERWLLEEVKMQQQERLAPRNERANRKESVIVKENGEALEEEEEDQIRRRRRAKREAARLQNREWVSE
jgi:hypothetical protein